MASGGVRGVGVMYHKSGLTSIWNFRCTFDKCARHYGFIRFQYSLYFATNGLRKDNYCIPHSTPIHSNVTLSSITCYKKTLKKFLTLYM